MLGEKLLECRYFLMYASTEHLVSCMCLYFKNSDNVFLAMTYGNQGYHEGESLLSIISV